MIGSFFYKKITENTVLKLMNKSYYLLIPRIIIILVAVIAATHSFAQGKQKKGLQLDSSFLAQSEKWQAKRVGTKKVFFGPFKTIASNSEKPIKISRSRNNDALFSFRTEIKKDHPLSLIVLYDRIDSVFVNMLYSVTNYSRKRSGLGTLVLGDKDFEESSEANCKMMTIDLPGDSLSWDFIPTLVAQEPGSSLISYLGKLVQGSDTVLIKRIKGFRTDGLSFVRSAKEVAAVQFDDNYVWIITQQEKKIKMLLGSFLVAYLSMRSQ